MRFLFRLLLFVIISSTIQDTLFSFLLVISGELVFMVIYWKFSNFSWIGKEVSHVNVYFQQKLEWWSKHQKFVCLSESDRNKCWQVQPVFYVWLSIYFSLPIGEILASWHINWYRHFHQTCLVKLFAADTKKIILFSLTAVYISALQNTFSGPEACIIQQVQHSQHVSLLSGFTDTHHCSLQMVTWHWLSIQ